MNQQKLNDHLVEHYQSQQLRPEKLEQLRALSESVTVLRDPPKKSVLMDWRRGWLAASFATLLTAVILLSYAQNDTHNAWINRAAHEIALNHKKQLAIEFVASDIATLREQMTKLDFVLDVPRNISIEGLQILGARYCSIQGHLAAQLRLHDAQGRVFTFYQRIADGVPAISAQHEQIIDGIQTRQWVEGGLFFGLGSRVEENSFGG